MALTPANWTMIESRLDTIYRIKQKFGMEVEELLARREAAAAELETLPVLWPKDCRAEGADADAYMPTPRRLPRSPDPEPLERLYCNE